MGCLKLVDTFRPLVASVSIAVALVGCRKTQSFDGTCKEVEEGPCVTDCEETPQGTPTTSNPRRFGLDSEYGEPRILERVVRVGDGLTEIQGSGLGTWGAIEPNAPIHGVATYLGPESLKPDQRTFLEEFGKTDRELSAVVEFFSNDWAMETHPTITVQSPRSGQRVPGFVRIRPEHHQDWKRFVKHYVSRLPNLRYLQVDNEPENVWVNGAGYAEALRLAYEAVQEYNTEHGKKIGVMAAGFYIGPSLMSLPESILNHMYEKFPNIDEAWIREQANLPESITSSQIQLASQKIHTTLSALIQEDISFDILTIHADHSVTFEESGVIIGWYRNVMKKRAYQRPIWIDDLHSASYPSTGPLGRPEDAQEYDALKNGDREAIREYYREQPGYLVKKSVVNFAAGAERIKIATLVDSPNFFMPQWRYAGLFTSELNRKASYYTAKLLVNRLDYFGTATKLQGNVYRFTFDHKNPVFVAWGEDGSESVDLSSELGIQDVRTTFLVNEVDGQCQPLVRGSVIMPSNKIPLTKEPVFIELAK